MHLLSTAALLLALSYSAPSQASSPHPAPTPWLQKQVERAKKLAYQEFETGTPAEEQWKKDIKTVVDDIIDWNELTQKSLGTRWKKLTPAEQDEFSGLLRQLAESSYKSKLLLAAKSSERGEKAKSATEKAKVTWTSEKVDGNNATAAAIVKSGKTKVQLGFELLWVNDAWRVWDVVIDEASTVRTYRTSFRKIMDKDGYPGLITRMKDRIEKIKSGKADLITAEGLD